MGVEGLQRCLAVGCVLANKADEGNLQNEIWVHNVSTVDIIWCNSHMDALLIQRSRGTMMRTMARRPFLISFNFSSSKLPWRGGIHGQHIQSRLTPLMIMYLVALVQESAATKVKVNNMRSNRQWGLTADRAKGSKAPPGNMRFSGSAEPRRVSTPAIAKNSCRSHANESSGDTGVYINPRSMCAVLEIAMHRIHLKLRNHGE